MNFEPSSRSIDGTSRFGTLTVAPCDLRDALGPFHRRQPDGYKVSGEWIFEDEGGGVYTVYDYKATSLYCSQDLSPEEFWNSRNDWDFSVGCHRNSPVNQFIAWLKEQVKPVAQKRLWDEHLEENATVDQTSYANRQVDPKDMVTTEITIDELCQIRHALDDLISVVEGPEMIAFTENAKAALEKVKKYIPENV